MKADFSHYSVRLYTEPGYNMIYRVLLYKVQWYAYNRSGMRDGEDPASWEEFIAVLLSSAQLIEQLRAVLEDSLQSYPEKRILFGRKLKASITTHFPSDQNGMVQIASLYKDPQRIYKLLDGFTGRVVERYYQQVFLPKHPEADEKTFLAALMKSEAMQNQIRRTIQICTSSLDYDRAWEDHFPASD